MAGGGGGEADFSATPFAKARTAPVEMTVFGLTGELTGEETGTSKTTLARPTQKVICLR